jgi:type I restriction-modification system DNA methylase subunit
MSGIDRDSLRVKATGEVFTPTPLVQEILDQLDPNLFRDINKTFIDPSCGDGQFLSEVLIRKLESVAEEGSITEQQFEQALSTIYGIELMPDNVDLCRERLLCGQIQFQHIVNRNIVQHDSLKYDEDFNGTDLTRKDYLLSGG